MEYDEHFSIPSFTNITIWTINFIVGDASQCHLMDFVVSPPGCGRSVTDFWGWHTHEAQLLCPDEVDGGTWIWSTRRGLNLSSTKLPRPWSPWKSSLSRKNPHWRTGNRTRDLMTSSQKLWPLYHEAGRCGRSKFCKTFKHRILGLIYQQIILPDSEILPLGEMWILSSPVGST
jgi:hypothetical protein